MNHKRLGIPKWLYYQIIVVVLLVFFGMYVYYLNRTMRFDETFTFIEYTASWIEALFEYIHPNNHLLHSFFMWVTRNVMGNSSMSIRFPAFVGAILSLAAMFQLGRRLFNRYVGLLAMILLGAAYPFADYAVNARGYTLTVLWTILLVEQIAFFKIPLSRRQSYIILLLSMLSIMTVPSMVLLTGALSFWQIGRAVRSAYPQNQLQAMYPIIFGTLLGSIFYAFSFITGIFDGGSGLGASGFIDLLSQMYNRLMGIPMSGWILLMGLPVGVVMAYIKKHSLLLQLYIYVLGGIIILTIIQYVVTQTLFFPRNYIFMLPMLALTAAFVIDQLHPYLTRISIIVILGLSVFSLQVLGKDSEIDLWLNAIEAQSEAGDVIITGCCILEPLYYHLSVRGDRDDILTYSDETRRFIVIPTSFASFEDLAMRYELTNLIGDCTIQNWGAGDVYVCALQEPSS